MKKLQNFKIVDSIINTVEGVMDNIALKEVFESNQLLKSIPILKTLINGYSDIKTIKGNFEYKKLVTLIAEINNYTINQKNLDTFKTKFESNNRFKDEVIESLIVINERFNNVEKSKILARLFVNYLEGSINWSDFQDLLNALVVITPSGLEYLQIIAKKSAWDNVTNVHELGQDLLMSAALAGKNYGYFDSAFMFKINILGQNMYNFGIIEKI
jgi:hypothetical protein